MDLTRVNPVQRLSIYGSSGHCAICRASTAGCYILDPQVLPKRTNASGNHRLNCECPQIPDHTICVLC